MEICHQAAIKSCMWPILWLVSSAENLAEASHVDDPTYRITSHRITTLQIPVNSLPLRPQWSSISRLTFVGISFLRYYVLSKFSLYSGCRYVALIGLTLQARSPVFDRLALVTPCIKPLGLPLPARAAIR